ncbi:hypothetical protein HZU40_11880 [Mycolicibacterium fluoranthenivorans]|uniref:Uncharacterized protein n=1 Tax=Mycolicibacterium fluoranthenivorans TaxID=258505 RepID=A0A7G8PKL2_9MYCO|nr:hypothetical protein [Mycolicibacterium fluoranthenivorans]QNJ94878.1 hypothetical protein HZU40_11880 [Mycolicibacterium fluoranthenivorans]
MEEIAGKNGWLLLCLIAAVCGYVITFGKHNSWPFYVLGLMFVAGLIGTIIGRRMMPKNPVLAVKVLPLCLFATLSATTLLLMVSFAVETWARHYFEFMDKPDQETLNETLLGIIPPALVFIGVRLFEKKLSKIFPAGQTQLAFAQAFGSRTEVGDNRTFNAIHEDRLATQPPIEGWKLSARIKRAEVLKALVAPPQPSNPASAPAQDQNVVPPSDETKDSRG